MAATKTDYYDILGISKGAGETEIKKAYRKQAMEWHPDKHQKGDKQAAEKRFKEINEAYQILSDAKKRQAYDKFGHSAFSPGGAANSAGDPFAGFGGQQGPFNYTYSANGANFGGQDFGDPFDIFEQFFGGGSPFRQQQRVPRYSINISFMDAVNGIEKEVSLNGSKRKIKIPAGIDEGNRIQFNDFVLSVNIKPSKIFERDGVDVYVAAPIPFTTAALGGEVSVPTLKTNKIKLKVRKGTQSGSLIRLRGEGIKHLRHNGYGDLYVKIIIETPKKLSGRQKALLNKLQKENL